MPVAKWKDTIIAESENYEMVEGNIYFPPDSIKQAFFKHSDKTSICFWKGTAHYYHVQLADGTNENAAWYYPEPKKAAANIKGYIAFWKGIEVTE